MPTVKYSLVGPNDNLTTPLTYFLCDVDADLPLTGLHIGDLAYVKESPGRLYVANSATTWRRAVLTGGGGGGAGTGAGSARVLGSGSTVVGAGATVTLGTFAREAGEVVSVFAWVTQDTAGVHFAEDRTGLLTGFTEGVGYYFERTAVANEFVAKAVNSNVTLARTLEWLILAWRT